MCPGSFDPVTNGHVDVVARASRLFDELVVAIGVNPAKSGSGSRLFADDERIAMLHEAFLPFSNVSVSSFTGLLTDFCVEQRAVAIVKGLRAGTDFDYELQMAQMNATITAPERVETVLLPTSPQWSYVSSSLVKEVAAFGGDVSDLVPVHVLGPLHRRLAERAARAAKEGR